MNKTDKIIEFPKYCTECREEMPQGIVTLVDTDEGEARVCACGHAVGRE